jgi:hypothetical protein
MTTYRSGIVTTTVHIAAPCVDCGKEQLRNRSFTGTPAENEAAEATWRARTVWCIPCWRKAGRPQ